MTKANSDEKKLNTNRLINEKSPYLLQHATNLVDWYPWGDEAFEKARTEDKPIFLSIGYSTCHWCHVMAHESFEDPEVAKLMNDTFVNIKVDREERPEIDNLYMTVCQMITGSGGWPLTIIMDAEKKPFTAGTYFPKESRYGRIGMLDLIPRIKEYWKNNREELQSAAKEVINQLQSVDSSSAEDFTIGILDEAFKEATLLFDEKNGGFRGAPKFPTPHKWLFLLRYWNRTKNEAALQIVEKTLKEMRKGGIFDHIGFGFHRYSTDSNWILPHFEKMLYDQALLTIAYNELYLATQNYEYRIIVDEILSYVLRDMTSSEGGFYSAQDADSEGEEGKFYTWTVEEIDKLLTEEEAQLFKKMFNFQNEGNFREEATREKTRRNIPYLTSSLSELADDFNITTTELKKTIEQIRSKLYSAREKRIHPHKDDKILTDWNGLMIVALASASKNSSDDTYIIAAEKAMQFILSTMTTSDNRLMHRYRDKHVAIPGFLDDYVFIIWALIELYESTFKVEYLEKAIEFKDQLLIHFWDNENGGFYFTPDDGEKLLVRKKEIYDGAIPSGNSVAMLILLRLSRITADLTLENKVLNISKSFSSIIEQSLLAYSMFLSAMEYLLGNSFEVVIVGDTNSDETLEMVKALYDTFVPNKVVMFLPTDINNPEILSVTDFVKDKHRKNNKTTAHVCINKFCKFPTDNIDKMLEELHVK